VNFFQRSSSERNQELSAIALSRSEGANGRSKSTRNSVRTGRSTGASVPESNAISALLFVVLLFPLNRIILPTPRRVPTKKALIRGSTPTDKATEKSRTSQPQDQGSPNNRQGKPHPGSKSDRVGRSFEPGSCVTDASDLHSENENSQIISKKEEI
jgi:hypothetical protein